MNLARLVPALALLLPILPLGARAQGPPERAELGRHRVRHPRRRLRLTGRPVHLSTGVADR